jgi:hypothetical protein
MKRKLLLQIPSLLKQKARLNLLASKNSCFAAD